MCLVIEWKGCMGKNWFEVKIYLVKRYLFIGVLNIKILKLCLILYKMYLYLNYWCVLIIKKIL